MLSPYTAVLRIYWTRVRSWWVASVFVVIALALLGTALGIAITIAPDPAGHHRIALQQMSLLATLGLGGLAFMLWWHFREMVVGEAGCLWPRYRRPHLIVFVGFSMMLFAVLPCALSYLAKTNSLGLFAISMALFAVNGWRAATRSLVIQIGFTIVGSVLPMLLLIQDNVAFDPSYPAAVAVILLSALVVAAACKRLLRQTEGILPFTARMQWGSDITRPRQTGDSLSMWRDAQRGGWLNRLGSRHKPYLPKKDNLWSGARRWRSLMPGVFIVAFMMAGTQAFISITPRIAFYRQQAQWRALCLKNPQLAAMPAPTPPTAGHTWSTILLIYLATIPVTSVGASWVLNQIGLAIGIQMCQMWAVFAAAFVLVTFIEFGRVDINGLVIQLAGSFGALVLGYGLLIWGLQYRSSAMAAVILCGLGTLLFIGIVALGTDQLFPVSPYIELLPLSLVGGGLYLVPLAYRRWLVTDLG
jgi:hypothetical protein